uniref:SRCR domain-containing protein n=1 Tax=Palpitomonas bilix TaxID=652834 RepID=A0A7S3LRY4_9EUKA|mmetsp:Transcript_43591/g.113542  ORF Transcript_43591/g.113542 Transcript_43591/m.113542 type:complete len:666 (+) Transcript_43591:190-2187(+)
MGSVAVLHFHLPFFLSLLLLLLLCVWVAPASAYTRLVAGGSTCSGYVSFSLSSSSDVAVCGDGWTDVNSQVVCTELGKGDAVYTRYGGDTAPTSFLATDFSCDEGQDSLGQCSFRILSTSTACEIGAVFVSCSCEGASTSPVTPVGETLYAIEDVRLVSGGATCQGVVQIRRGSQWGTLCDDGFRRTDATVLCKLMGFSGTSGYSSTSAPFGTGFSPMIGTEVECQSSSLACTYENVGDTCNSERETVALICDGCNDAPSPAEPSVRLVGGKTACEGNVQVYYANRWGYVCGDYMSAATPDVICRQMGFEGGGSPWFFGGLLYGGDPTTSWSYVSPSPYYLMNEVTCDGDESSILECLHTMTSECNDENIASVVCYGNELCDANAYNSFVPRALWIPLTVVSILILCVGACCAYMNRRKLKSYIESKKRDRQARAAVIQNRQRRELQNFNTLKSGQVRIEPRPIAALPPAGDEEREVPTAPSLNGSSFVVGGATAPSPTTSFVMSGSSSGVGIGRGLARGISGRVWGYGRRSFQNAPSIATVVEERGEREDGRRQEGGADETQRERVSGGGGEVRGEQSASGGGQESQNRRREEGGGEREGAGRVDEMSGSSVVDGREDRQQGQSVDADRQAARRHSTSLHPSSASGSRDDISPARRQGERRRSN